MSKFQPIETLTPEYGQEVILRAPDTGYGTKKGDVIRTIAIWCKKAEEVYGPRGGRSWVDAWQLTDVGGHAEDANIGFTPTHWAPLPEEPDE